MRGRAAHRLETSHSVKTTGRHKSVGVKDAFICRLILRRRRTGLFRASAQPSALSWVLVLSAKRGSYVEPGWAPALPVLRRWLAPRAIFCVILRSPVA